MGGKIAHAVVMNKGVFNIHGEAPGIGRVQGVHSPLYGPLPCLERLLSDSDPFLGFQLQTGCGLPLVFLSNRDGCRRSYEPPNTRNGWHYLRVHFKKSFLHSGGMTAVPLSQSFVATPFADR